MGASRYWLWASGLGATLALAVFVQLPTQNAFFCDDSIAVPIMIDAIRRDSLTSLVLWLSAGNGHHHPLWTALFGIELDLFGFDPRPWHWANAAYHGLTAFLAGLLVYRWTNSRLASATTALLWAGTIVGGYDDVAMTIFEAHYSLGLMGVLTTLFSFDRYLDRPNWFWLLITAAAIVVTSLTWFVAWTGLIALPLVLFIRPNRDRTPRRYSIPWLLPGVWLTVGLAQISLILLQASGSNMSGAGLAGLEHFPMYFAQAIDRWLLSDPTEPAARPSFAWSLFWLSLALFTFMNRSERLTAGALTVLPSSVVALTSIARQPGPIIDADYLYYPTFSWCVFYGLGLGAIARRSSILGVTLAGTLVLGVVDHSSEKLAHSLSAFSPRMQEVEQEYRSHCEVLLNLEGLGKDSQTHVRVPNLLLPFQPNIAMPLPMSALLRWQREGHLSHVVMVEPSAWTPADTRRLEEQLSRIRSPYADRWKKMLTENWPEIQAIVEANRQWRNQPTIPELSSQLLWYPESNLLVSAESLLLQESGHREGIYFRYEDTASRREQLDRIEAGLDDSLRRSSAWKSFCKRFEVGTFERKVTTPQNSGKPKPREISTSDP